MSLHSTRSEWRTEYEEKRSAAEEDGAMPMGAVAIAGILGALTFAPTAVLWNRAVTLSGVTVYRACFVVASLWLTVISALTAFYLSAFLKAEVDVYVEGG